MGKLYHVPRRSTGRVVSAKGCRITSPLRLLDGQAPAPPTSLLPSSHVLVPADLDPNAGYNDGAQAGTLSNAEVSGNTIVRLQSFGANWCMLDLDPIGVENQWAGIPQVTVTFSGAFEGSGTLGAVSGYSYGGLIADVRAGLIAAIGQDVSVQIAAA